MSNSYNYMNLPNDLSGSMAKNRFRNEILWGLKRILELQEEGANYTAIFDFACDVEIHYENKCQYEFYQLKTENTLGKYPLSKLIKTDKGNSILGKLYILKYCEKGLEQEFVKVAVVSNSPFYDGKKLYPMIEEFDFLTLEQKQKEKVIKSLETELNKNISLDNTFFIRTGIDLFNPKITLKGEIADFYKRYYHSEPKKINVLFDSLESEVQDRACYELKIKDYSELKKYKGLSKSDVDVLLHEYIENTDTSFIVAKDKIKQLYSNNVQKKILLLANLKNISTELYRSLLHQECEFKIKDYCQKNLISLPSNENDLIEKVIENFVSFDTSINSIDLNLIVIIVLSKIEEELYE